MKNQNLKAGDKLLCKKPLVNTYASYLIEFKYYHIYEVSNINEYEDYADYDYAVMCEHCQIVNFRHEDEFHDYFYTEKQVRKIKLLKLNEEAEY